MKISIIGAGSFGSALTELATRCGNEVMLWAHDSRVAESISETRSNPFYLPAAQFTDQVHVTNSLADAAAFSDTLVMVTPSHHFRGVLGTIRESLDGPVNIISATKGIENDSLKRMSEVASEVLEDRLGKFGCLSGPTFALEVSRGDPTAAVIACIDGVFAEEVQRKFSCRTFRAYRTDDLPGVEVAGSLKNVIAIAAGVVEGIGLGYNTTAALITRGLHEVRKLGMALGGRAETFAGLAGIGDLVLTCTGSLSRNRSVGMELGQGKSLEQILAETRRVAEGVKTCRSAHELAEKFSIEMPITEEMYRVLYEQESPRNAIQRLMSRSLKSE